MPPTAQAPVPRSAQETWRERPRCARWKWPRACPEGSLTPWLSVSCLVVWAYVVCFGIAANPGPHVGTEWNADLPDNLVPLVREILTPNCSRSARDDEAGCGVRCVRPTVAHFRSKRHANNHGHIGCDGHHAIHARSVLGTVQGSSLRSACACARPVGLDGACAQITSWPLRDGRRCDGFSWADLDR